MTKQKIHSVLCAPSEIATEKAYRSIFSLKVLPWFLVGQCQPHHRSEQIRQREDSNSNAAQIKRTVLPGSDATERLFRKDKAMLMRFFLSCCYAISILGSPLSVMDTFAVENGFQFRPWFAFWVFLIHFS